MFDRRAGVYLFAAGSIAAGLLDLIWGEFEAAHQPIQSFGDQVAAVRLLAYIAAVWLIAGGAAILLPRTARIGAGALGAIYFLFAVFCLPRFYTAPQVLGLSLPLIIGLLVGVGQQLILVAAAAIVYASTRDSSAQSRSLLIARWIFGLSAVDFGLAHYTAIKMVVPMVPKWLPFGGNFWSILTGIAFLLAGIAILSGIRDVLAARLLALMLLLFSILVLAPGPFAHPANHIAWGSNAYNLAAVGAVWIYAASITPTSPFPTRSFLLPSVPATPRAPER